MGVFHLLLAARSCPGCDITRGSNIHRLGRNVTETVHRVHRTVESGQSKTETVSNFLKGNNCWLYNESRFKRSGPQFAPT